MVRLAYMLNLNFLLHSKPEIWTLYPDSLKICGLHATNSLKHDNINKFCLIVRKVWTKYSVPKLRYKPFTPSIKTFATCFKSVTLFIICVYKCLMNIVLNFIFLQCSKAEIWTPHCVYQNVYYMSQNHSSVIILIICVYVLNMPNFNLVAHISPQILSN